MSDAVQSEPVANMAKGWVRAPLSRFLTLIVETVDVQAEETYPTVGVLNRGRGLLYRDPVAGGSTAYKKLNRIGPGELVYSRLKAFEGAITVTPDGLPESFASQEFPTFAFKEGADSDFFRILTTAQSTWDVLQETSKGMGGRRERVNADDFLNIVMDIPPLPVQERIAEIISAIDDHNNALDNEAEAATSLRAALLAESLTMRQGKEWGEVRLSEVSTPLAGPAFKASAFASTPVGPRLLRGINLGRFGTRWNGADTVFWPESVSGAFQKYLLEPGDVCIAMDRPFTRDRVLRCGLIQGADLPALLVQRVTRLRAHHNRIMPEFLILVVQSPGMAERLAGRQTPGGYAPHISGRDISEFTFALPPLTVQERIAEVIGAMDAKITAVRAEANRLRSVRAGLLSGLLNRAIDIESAEVGV